MQTDSRSYLQWVGRYCDTMEQRSGVVTIVIATVEADSGRSRFTQKLREAGLFQVGRIREECVQRLKSKVDWS